MAATAVERELLDLERQYWQAIRDRDFDTSVRLSDDPSLVTGAQGVGSVSRQVLGAMFREATWTLESFELKDMQVRLLQPDVGVVAYRVHEVLRVDGQPLTLDAADTSTWVRRDGRWLCAVHTEALAGDPFGRDRRPGPSRKDKAISFLQKAAAGDVQAAYDQFVAPDFIHHNPYFAGDRESLRQAMSDAAQASPNKAFEVQHVYEDGDTVVVHSRVVRQDPGAADIAVVHILRFEGDQVAELWDLAQEVAADSPNENGMF